MGVSHEAMSVAIMLRPIIVPIVRVFGLALSHLPTIWPGPRLLVGITTFSREQLFVLLR
jgi:hypothetical protein